ncbi:hypothetical protein [Actinomycetospora termitidis]|uniref:Uncharacterized protein n=1 Tax=Actinomycetospora termitidis TaxID=3053470 RepID=A0ABT7M634_9PSEU|nr:hypothetical protein [Actinomycetospora sp. Odt1-22]MDL5155532.1 hypothetical protein [Actinomycetospora sp. Odt1-22]
MTTTDPSPRTSTGPRLRWWPALLGLAVAALSGADLLSGGVVAGSGPAVVLAVPVLVYLVAATSGRRRWSWPTVGLATVVVVGSALLGADPVVGILTVAGAVLVAALVTGRLAPTALPAAGAVGFGAVAASGVVLVPTAGALVVGVGLLGHAAWDVVHHRRGTVVTHSLAEFCAVLDTPARDRPAPRDGRNPGGVKSFRAIVRSSKATEVGAVWTTRPRSGS